jgi:hypothetical protein
MRETRETRNERGNRERGTGRGERRGSRIKETVEGTC